MSQSLKVLLTDYAWPDLEIERQLLEPIGAELVVAESGDTATLKRLAADADAIMTNWAKVPAEVIQAAAPRCQIICRLGIGLDNIDIPAATAAGIVVTNIPDYCLVEVAEHTLALILGLGRKIGFYHLQTKNGVYDLQAGGSLRRLEGQTLGLVGFGNIGRLVAQKAQALGLKVIATTQTKRDLGSGVEWVELPKLLAESDYVSLHLPMTAENRHLFAADAFRQMKPEAFLINTARGGLIDHQALTAALEAGELAGAALDVQDREPPDLTQAPYTDPRVIVTPHAAFASAESLADLRSRTTQQIIDRLSGKTPAHVINPEVLAGV